MFKNLIVSVKNRVLSLTINRPELKNALNRELYASLADQLEKKRPRRANSRGSVNGQW